MQYSKPAGMDDSVRSDTQELRRKNNCNISNKAGTNDGLRTRLSARPSRSSESLAQNLVRVKKITNQGTSVEPPFCASYNLRFYNAATAGYFDADQSGERRTSYLAETETMNQMSVKDQLLAKLAERLARTLPGQIVRVAIDGVDGAGKSTFADELGGVISGLGRTVIRATVDGFHNPKAVRYRQGRNSPAGFFEDSYDYAALKKYLLDPLGPGGTRRYRRAVFDHKTDNVAPVDEVDASPFAILLFDGIFLHRPELLACWDVSIFLKTTFATSVARCALRDGSSADPADPSNQRYVEGQRFYLRSCQPEARATIVIDYNDLSLPKIL